MKNDRLRIALRQLPVPEPDPDLLPRILRDRVLGKRLVIPMGERPPSRRWFVGAAAAAVVVLVLGGSWAVWITLSKTSESHPASSTDAFRPAYPLVLSESLDTSRLRAGVWTYRSETTTDDILTEPSGVDRIRMGRGTLAGQHVWWVSTGGRDTTYLDPSSLRPVRVVTHQPRAGKKLRTRFEQRFTADSGYERWELTGPVKDSSRGAIALPFPRNALFSGNWWPSNLDVVFPALPLRRDWRGSLYHVAFIARLGLRGVRPINLRVVGTDRVTVPAGTFECWLVEVDDFAWDLRQPRMWISRDKGWLIKEEQGASDFVQTRFLESYKHLELRYEPGPP
jgi:hypothetical protein